MIRLASSDSEPLIRDGMGKRKNRENEALMTWYMPFEDS